MAADPPGSTKTLTDSRGEGRPTLISSPRDLPDSDSAIQALVNSFAPGANSSAETPSREDVSRLSDKLKDLLSDSDLPQDTARRNERGEVCALRWYGMTSIPAQCSS
jgi:hypothetical protein